MSGQTRALGPKRHIERSFVIPKTSGDDLVLNTESRLPVFNLWPVSHRMRSSANWTSFTTTTAT